MEKIYEGKAKEVYSTENSSEYIIRYKDTATAGNGEKRADILGKGELNLAITTAIFKMLEENRVKTHYVETIDERQMRVKKVEIIPLEVIVRNISAGSFAKRYGVEEGITFETPTFELSYKNDDLGDPLMVEDHAIALGIITKEEYDYLKNETFKINELLKEFFGKINLKLVDFKIEYGKDENGNILLADEISPDTCRLWDKDTNQKYDKDIFRRDLGDLIEGYKEVLNRING
ncbi:phosphoribosylaminoimidazole-succinocarboxamide synthase [Peptoniphilus asaccharolyticus DSM 20463]|uniref:Phosphoribosylaminoimidazole-succinocarboxamide synthase n=1 Tax=Peptoniphilus asaccharolyticus DSM 20463 TaxID=573058 RepID=A0A1W1UYE8_PEPAS|nr:phosphoribosylaminoimidazolesuccinocarboxamide synthase [Peptoniphilus asaccharolyticus]MBL7575353.1 phosphoribosylaminoimidazolesuccinocarboxamide synthase [Peptoniphilus asaccharolyticus]SMB86123.1 phosphoribosylaminoimidazole-succinocarboxamide synthase [Peptoniphilus asaccharolyticus DSM 20463]